MNITRDNYEPFFLDYLEGNLEENMIDQFLDFLETNPDLKEELHLFENIHLPEESRIFTGKEQLYKSSEEAKASFENKTIAYLEGDLGNDESGLFETYLAAHPELKKEYELFSKTRLQPDPKIIFQGKNKLYKKSAAVVFMNWTARAAAVLILFWGINSVIQIVNRPGQQNSVPVIAEVSPKSVPQVKKNEPEKKTIETDAPEKVKTKMATKPDRIKSFPDQNNGRMEETLLANSLPVQRDLTELAQISPIKAQFDQLPVLANLAVSKSMIEDEIIDQRNVSAIEGYLASRAKKVTNEGLLSAQRIARVGLGIVSEISGERIGYSAKDGKISSLDFESKLLAFSIPFEKK